MTWTKFFFIFNEFASQFLGLYKNKILLIRFDDMDTIIKDFIKI